MSLLKLSKFLTGDDARLPTNPKARFYKIVLLGAERGVYYVVGVRIFNQEILNKWGRVPVPTFEFEEEDENLRLH